jgi:serine/threonine protein kinase
MGSVYLALHTGTKRNVAVKVISPQYMRNKELLIRFQREAEATGRLNHPNVVNVTDFGVTVIDATPIAYLVMEYLQGQTLQEYLQQDPTPSPDFVMDVLEQTALGITAAHSHGILHRDLKPQNIWLQPDGRGSYIVKVLDFGIAKLADPSGTLMELPELEAAPNAAEAPDDENATVILAPTELGLTSAFSEATGFTTTFGATLGTPAFMSPEQCRGEAVSEKSDLYSFAMISYLLLAGELPFQGNAKELIEQQISREPDPPHKRNPRLSEVVSRPVLESLAKQPQERAPSLLAFVSRLRAAIFGELSLLRDSKATATNQPTAWFGFLVASVLPSALLLTGARYFIRQAMQEKVLNEVSAAGIVVLLHLLLAYVALVFSDVMMTRWTLHLRGGEANFSDWLRVVQSAYRHAASSLAAALFTLHPLKHALAHVIVNVEGKPAAEARGRSAYLMRGHEPAAFALLVRRVAVTVMIVTYIPVIMMSLRVPVPIILREFIVGSSAMGLGLISFSFAPVYGSFMMAWYALYERARRSLGESMETVHRKYEVVRGMIGARVRTGTKFWAAVPVFLLALSLLPPFLGWNETVGDNLNNAVMEGRIADVRQFIAQGEDLNESRGRGRPPLVTAVQNGDLELVKLLIAAGAKVNPRTDFMGPIHYAVVARRREILEFLLDQGASVNAQDNTGDTALSLAAKRGDAEIVELLLRRGANPAIKNLEGKLPVEHARRLGHEAVVRLLESR